MRFTKIKPNFTFLFFLIGTFANTWGIPGSNNSVRVLLVFAGLFSLLKILQTKVKRNVMILLSFMLISTIIIYLKSGELSPFVTVVSLFCFYGMKFDEIIDLTICSKSVILALKLFLVKVGIISNGTYSYWRVGKLIERYTFGYTTGNGLSIQLATLSFLIIYKIRNINACKRTICYLLIATINYIFYMYTKSQTSVIVVAFVLLCSFLKNLSWFRKLFLKGAIYILPALCICSIIGGILYGKNSFITSFDLIISGRFYYCHRLLTTLGFSLFGNTVSGTNIIYDNSYVRILCNLGIIYFLFIIVGMFIISYKEKKKKNFELLLLLVGFQILGFTESIYGYFFSNVTLFLLIGLCQKSYKREISHKSVETVVKE